MSLPLPLPNAWLDRWLHPECRADPAALQDGRVLVTLLHLAAPLVAVFSFAHLVTGNLWAAGSCLVTTLALLTLLEVTVRSPKLDRVIQLFLVVSVSSITITAAVAGEHRWLVLLFLAFVPTAPAALLELRQTLRWAAICLLSGLWVLGASEAGYLPEVQTGISWSWMYAMTFTSMVSYAAVAGFVVQRSQRLLLLRAELDRASAEEAERMRRRFLANVSHELRTPLHGLMGTVEDLIRGPRPPEELRDGLNTIRASTDTLLALVNDLLTLTRSEQTRLEPVVFKVPVLLDDVVALFRALADERDLKLETRVDPALHAQAWVADRRRITQVLSNLLSNAIKYTLRGRVILRARAERNMLLLRVSDTGPGLPAEVQARLFEPFVTAENGRHEVSTGLGLNISRSITRDLGGELVLVSTGPAGTTFQVVVPVSEVPSAAPELTPVEELPDLQGMRVLLAEDHLVNQRVTAMMVRRLGATIDVVPDGAQAMSILRRREHDVLLLDWFMPVLDGAGVLQALREEGLDPYVIVMSAQVDPDVHAALRQAGAHTFLAKPCGLAELAKALRKAWRRPVQVEERAVGR